jgi:hypothetical protein
MSESDIQAFRIGTEKYGGNDRGRYGKTPRLIVPRGAAQDHGPFYSFVKEQGIITVNPGMVLFPAVAADGTINELTVDTVLGADVTVADGDYVHFHVEMDQSYSIILTSETDSHRHNVRQVVNYPKTTWNFVADPLLSPGTGNDFYYPICQYHDDGTVFSRDLLWPGGWINLSAFVTIQDYP